MTFNVKSPPVNNNEANRMLNLIINRIKYDLKIPEEGINIYCFKTEAMFRLKYQYFLKELSGHTNIKKFREWFGGNDQATIEDQPYVFFSFQPVNQNDSFQFNLKENSIRPFKKRLIRQILVDHFKNKDVLIEPYPIGVDLSIYVFVASFDNNWNKYSCYDFIVRQDRNEIIFNRTRENVLISKLPLDEDSLTLVEFGNLNGIVPNSRIIKKTKDIMQRPLLVIASNEMRPPVSPRKISYKNLYNDIKTFYSEHLLQLKTDNFKIQSGGLIHLNEKDIDRVYGDSNVMVFKDEKTDINTATGMRTYGPFKTSPRAKDVQFIFIYENSDDANNLYRYLKNGLRHFPGLQTYVQIPPTLSDLRMQYDRKNLKDKFNDFLSKQLPEEHYENYFALFICPFRKNLQMEDSVEPKLYYYIKNELLKKGISSQDIFYKNIRSDQFHFYLPNIAIAILAKLGGIPWKLKNQPYKELIIGFNTKYINENLFIGSSVFFDNQGYLRNINSYEANNLRSIVSDLKHAIQIFRIENSAEELKRIIIHTYKPYGKKEQNIEEILCNEIQLDIPFVYVEINESKTCTEVCFDENYDYGMPISGSYVRTGRNEYLLFNNTRYNENPSRYVMEEWPIKVKIYTSGSIILEKKQLISQVYEFSRLYWKGLRQKSKPVSTIYSKLIAEYRGNFGEQIPKNKIANETPWFL